MKSSFFSFGVGVYAWSALLVAGALMLNGCASLEDEPFPSAAPCADYEADMVAPAGQIPTLSRAPFGVRFVAPADFAALVGPTYPLATGTLVMEVWVYHWFDGDHVGAVGRTSSGGCRWYATPSVL